MKVNYKSLTDAQLAGLINADDKLAMEEVYERYWSVLYIHAKKMLQDEEQAKDIVQDLFTNLFVKMGNSLTLAPAIGGFLYTGIRNLVLDQMRRKKVRAAHLENLIRYAVEGELVTDQYIRSKELQEVIEKEITKLPPKMRAVFEMSRKNFLSHKEIAEAYDLSEMTVRKQISLAIKRLRSKITCYFCLQLMYFILWLHRSW